VEALRESPRFCIPVISRFFEGESANAQASGHSSVEYRNLISEPLTSTDVLYLNPAIKLLPLPLLAPPSGQLLSLLALAMPVITHPSTDSNRTLIPRAGHYSDNPSYPPNHGPRRVWISNLPFGLEYASSDTHEVRGSAIIQSDDPNAGTFAGRCAGGGRRDEIYGNR